MLRCYNYGKSSLPFWDSELIICISEIFELLFLFLLLSIGLVQNQIKRMENLFPQPNLWHNHTHTCCKGNLPVQVNLNNILYTNTHQLNNKQITKAWTINLLPNRNYCNSHQGKILPIPLVQINYNFFFFKEAEAFLSLTMVYKMNSSILLYCNMVNYNFSTVLCKFKQFFQQAYYTNFANSHSIMEQ